LFVVFVKFKFFFDFAQKLLGHVELILDAEELDWEKEEGRNEIPV